MIRVQIDPSAVLKRLDGFENQAGYAMSLALNRVANLAQEAQREQMKQAFKLRRETFVLRGVKISKADRASKSTWRVVIQIAYPDDRRFMHEHEKGGERKRHGGRFLWQPNAKIFRGIITKANPLHPKNLNMRKTPAGQIKGDHRTFMVRTQQGQRLVLQRVDRRLDARSLRGLKTMTLDNFAGGMGPRRKQETRSIRRTAGTRLLYRLVDRVRIPADLQFVKTVGRTVQAQWEKQAAAAARRAIETAR